MGLHNLVCYAHGGSGNHGCEAIVRSTRKILMRELHDSKIILLSHNRDEDLYYNINTICDVAQTRKIVKYSPRHVYYKLKSILTKSTEHYAAYMYNGLLFGGNGDVYFSIGGDNYCYSDYSWLSNANKRLNNDAKRTILWGCSVEPESLQSSRLVEDMKRYSLITARETITYNALIDAGVTENTRLIPDPAFLLDTVKLDLPTGFAEDNTVGINLSPLISRYEKEKGAAIKNYSLLIDHIIKTTDFQVALISHVTQIGNNDSATLSRLYAKYKNSGRVVIIGDHNCMELKGFISRCRMFIGARTHATIAAYSSCVPTLVVGYSVKAKGIARDIFGTYDNYVLPVQALENEDDLIKAFEWMKDNETSIKSHLDGFMPTYIERAWEAGAAVKELLMNE